MVPEEHDVPATGARNSLHDDAGAKEERKDMLVRYWRGEDQANGAVEAPAGRAEEEEPVQVRHGSCAEHRQHVQQRSKEPGRETEEEGY